MPTFFRRNELTEEQKNNWDSAIANYTKVLELNALHQLQAMSDSDKKEYMGEDHKGDFTEQDVLKRIMQDLMVMGNTPGHEKSALFFRLLSGKQILKNPPPTSYSYPYYDIIESTNNRQLMLDGENIKELTQPISEYVPYPYININQNYWKIVETISPTKAVVTFGRWENEGFLWEVELAEITAEESKSAIYCSHDPSIKKITTYDVLLKECLHRSKEHFHLLKIANIPEEYKKYEAETIAKYPREKVDTRISIFLQNQIKNTLETAKNMLAERIKNGLPIYATDEEIQEYADNLEKQYLRNEYFPKDGLLYHKVWVMKRITPTKLTEDHYLKI
jgi:hypothetical protein